MMTELALSAYRPFPGKAEELEMFLTEELATLRSRGHVTHGCRSVLVVVEWASDHAVGEAHTDPEVIALWERKALGAAR